MTVTREQTDQTDAEEADTANPWAGFTVEPSGVPPVIKLEQVDRSTFKLGSTVRYWGPTGLPALDPESERRLRSVDPSSLPSTDLASVPGPFRWWVKSYGIHTPAALIHDRFIGDPEPGDPGRPLGVTEQQIDRYFRFMLRELGVPFFRRWLMWAAVAGRTRIHGGLRRATSMVIWFVLAVFGVVVIVAGAVGGEWGLIAVATLLPIPASALWGRQAGAGLIIAYVGVPCLLAPSALAVPFLLVYAVVEAVGQQCSQLLLVGVSEEEHR